jgi:diguanylate cyclase (GGDEF)-like protein
MTNPPTRGESLLRALPLVAPVAAGGVGIALASVAHLYSSWSGPSVLAAVAALLAAATLAEAYPVPVDAAPAGQISLAAVFVVGAAVVYGWAEAALVAYGARTAIELIQRRPAEQLLYNGPVYALAAAAAGAAAGFAATGSSASALALEVGAAAVAFYVLNLVLVTAMFAIAALAGFRTLLVDAAVRTFVPFTIMASSALMLAVLWEREPLLSLALVGPLLAIALYQRSVHGALVATRLALTDSLTGLGNQRHFHERLQQELDSATTSGRPLALCILDVDDLKHVNDTFGHPVGDRLLERVAACLRHGGESFRVGGDEFALLLPDREAEAAREIATAVLERATALDVADAAGGGVRVSAGVAVFPSHCRERNDLYRCADEALYAAKRAGGKQVMVFAPPSPPPEMRSIPGGY